MNSFVLDNYNYKIRENDINLRKPQLSNDYYEADAYVVLDIDLSDVLLIDILAGIKDSNEVVYLEDHHYKLLNFMEVLCEPNGSECRSPETKLYFDTPYIKKLRLILERMD